MTDNSFCIRVRKDVVSFLKKMENLQESCFDPNDHYSSRVREIARAGSHYEILTEIWNTHSNDFLLNDESIFQFHKSGKNLRYCFMQNSIVKVSWEVFLEKNNVKEEGLAPEDLEIYSALYDNGDDESCYEHIEYPVYLRYDLSVEQYQECFHPYSHLHVGLHNEIRFPISRELTPEMFAQIAIKMTYPELWREKIEKNEILESFKTVKKGCIEVPKKNWSELDKCDLFFC